MNEAFDRDTRTTADERGELFGVHIPELQLPVADYRSGLRAAQLSPGERYLELGSGHGRGLVLAATEFDVEAAVGVEYLEDAAARTVDLAERAGVGDRIEVLREDVRRADPAGFDVVHMHLGPAFHDVLAARLERLLAPDTRVVAAGWRVPGWLPLDVAWDAGYVYRPADPELHLVWDEPSSSGRFEADVHADLDRLEVRVDGAALPSSRARCTPASPRRGQRLTMAVEPGSIPDGAVVSIWAHGRDGRVTQRGATVVAPAD